MEEILQPDELITPLLSSLREKVTEFEQELKCVADVGEKLMDSVKKNTDRIHALSTLEENILQDIQKETSSIVEHSKTIQVKLVDPTFHSDAAATMKELDGQIDRLKNEVQHCRMNRKQIDHKTQKLQKHYDKIKKKTEMLKSNTKLKWYKSLCPLVWHQWKETVGQPGIEVVGEFQWHDATDDCFSLVVACSSECSSWKVVANIDWVWDQIREEMFHTKKLLRMDCRVVMEAKHQRQKFSSLQQARGMAHRLLLFISRTKKSQCNSDPLASVVISPKTHSHNIHYNSTSPYPLPLSILLQRGDSSTPFSTQSNTIGSEQKHMAEKLQSNTVDDPLDKKVHCLKLNRRHQKNNSSSPKTKSHKIVREQNLKLNATGEKESSFLGVNEKKTSHSLDSIDTPISSGIFSGQKMKENDSPTDLNFPDLYVPRFPRRIRVTAGGQLWAVKPNCRFHQGCSAVRDLDFREFNEYESCTHGN